MHLESFTIQNFRKFGNKDNTVHFVNSTAISVGTENENQSLIAPSGTLIIGKNNAGKTTIARALRFICSTEQPKVSDFNIDYLKELFKQYKGATEKDDDFEQLPTPELRFVIEVKVDLTNNEGDLVNRLSQFVPISGPASSLVKITIKYQIKEERAFKESVKIILNDGGSSVDHVLKEPVLRFYDLLNEEKTGFNILYLNSSEEEVNTFRLNNLFNIKEIEANRRLEDGVLSRIYKHIVTSQYKNNDIDKAMLQQSIHEINEKIDTSVASKSKDISSILQEIEPSNHVGVSLNGDVNEDTILKSLIKYSFSDGDDDIPENQFGLGYINLLNIIGEIIHYIDSYEEKSYKNQINLLFIEEPEAFMHPQMQEFFITRIDNAVKKVLEVANSVKDTSDKVLHCQLVITTHSSHIVNSKIHSSNSFNNINYLNSIKRKAVVVKLDDELVAGKDVSTNDKALKFIKKHIKYKVSELFFSDAVIFVEGITEETLLHYYLEQEPTLKNYYISIFNINGAHGKLYFPLVKALKIPCLIITDLDIKREKCEKNESHKKDEICTACHKTAGVDSSEKSYVQVNTLNKKTTTNVSIASFNQKLHHKNETESYNLDDINYFEDDNLYVIFQKDAIEGQFATSFEEAFILTNYDNDILNSVLKSCKPSIYKEVVDSEGSIDKSKLINNSFKLQKKLSDSKSDFANNLLYECITRTRLKSPTLPDYIKDGFNWLGQSLSPKSDKGEVDDTHA